MPSFLNKVFGYKKSDDKDAARPSREASDSTLLDGKYEAIPSALSPSASTFAEAQSTRDSDRDLGFSFFLPKSRASSQKPAQKHPEAVPTLTLKLPGLKENLDSRALGVVFEADPESQAVLDDAVIAAKRLNPLEALILVRACAQAITERGLETLGIMHPHWLSASPDVQRKLVSLFIRSLTPQSRITTLSPTPTAPTSAFENELHYTRSPHDVAAVLRWGLRHLSLENGHFGKDDDEWAWYNVFFHAERNASYPPQGFSELLLPQLPPSHIELLTATLSLVSSLASHAESNSISGSKLSKFLGIWLLVAARGKPSDDWNRFYARWERAGRILEHLFLARLREESLKQRLPTRLQELVKHYPYNKGSLATEDELLPRPRFSTRQYDALFVRIETLLTHGADQPKQHPIQILLEAFQLPIENPSGDEHVALWNTLKTTASEEATSSDEGLQFARVFADETIQLLSLIPADNNVPASPTLLTSPITKVVSRKRSSSLTKVLERTTPRSNANNGSTPGSPTSPSSPVITDWAQFSLSGFGDIPTTQPLAAILDQDDDIEVTQPRISPKSSRRGKSRTRRRRSEDQEPLDTPLSSQSKSEPSIVETKLASVHVIQVDEAFIDFWSDAIVDPISANWPTFVVCGLKQIPSAELPIRWLVIEQIYSLQPQPRRIPSPDGQRGRSPRPSFRSDISGFRINSVFSSARKRLSVFNKSATDLDTKKSGGKTLIAGELGEALVEEEPALPSIPPVKVDDHVDGNGVGAAASSGPTANVADQLKADENLTAPIAGVPSTVLKESDPVQVVDPTPQSGDGYDSFSVLPRSSVRTSEAVSVEQGSPRTIDVVNPKVNAADPVTRIVPLATGTFDLRSTQDAGLPAELPPIAENPVAEEVPIQFRQGVFSVETEDQLVAQPADSDECLPAESTGKLSNGVQVDVVDGSREVAGGVAMPPAPETGTAVIIDDQTPEDIAEESQIMEQPSRQAPIEFVAASTVASVGQHLVDHLPVSAPDVQDKVIVTEAGAQLAPDSIAAVVDADEEATEVPEPMEIPTPAPGEFVVLVEDTPGLEVSVDAYGRAGAARDPAAELEAFDDAALEPMAAESQAILRAEEEPSAHPVEEPSVEIVRAVGISAQVVGGETKQVPELATEEAQSLVQDTVVEAVETPLVVTFPVPEANVSAAQDVALVEVEAQAAPDAEAQGTGVVTPAPEDATLVDETPGPEVTTETYEPVEVAPATVAAGSEAVEDKAPEPCAAAKARPTDAIALAEDVHIEGELPTRFAGTEAVVALPTESFGEAATAALATMDDDIALRAAAQQTPDAPAEDAEAQPSILEGAPLEEIVIETHEPAQLAPDTAAGSEPDAADPVIDEAQVIVEDAALSASEPIAVTPVITEEPVTRDVQVSIEIEEASSESASQSADEAANAPIVPVSAPGPQEVAEDAEFLAPDVGVLVEDTEAVKETDEEPVGAPAPIVDETDMQAAVEAEEPASEVTEAAVAGQPEAAVEVDEADGVDDLQKTIDLAERPVRSEIEVSTHEPAEISETAGI